MQSQEILLETAGRALNSSKQFVAESIRQVFGESFTFEQRLIVERIKCLH